MHLFESSAPQIFPHDEFVRKVTFHPDWHVIFSVLTNGLCLGVNERALSGFGVRWKQIVQVNQWCPCRAQERSSLSIHHVFLLQVRSCNKIKVQFYSKRCFLLGTGQGRRESKVEEKVNRLRLLGDCWLTGKWGWKQGKWWHVQITMYGHNNEGSSHHFQYIN